MASLLKLTPTHALLLLLVSVFAAPSSAGQAGAGVPGTAMADQPGAMCVKPTEWMRRNHMEVINHSRDLTVHQGIRVKDDSLANCVTCHTRMDKSNRPVAINQEGEFCASCHTYTAVNITCFQCHSTVPDSETAQR